MDNWKPPEGYALVLQDGAYVKGFDRNREYCFLRYGDVKPDVFRMADVHPYFNIAGLYYARHD
ncbi:hypothetical protein [Sphingomonas sp. LK11]|uniref:hypothetical protein n=1 Tax=Sphingomonas sp. LK11 TaxID=1390395 RepID=UPI0012EBE3E2|nr:hypothetical protein [Sphingomonas sp. LK11]